VLDLARLFSGSRDLGFVTDLRGGVQASTRGSEQALGYTPEELLGLDLPGLDESGELRRVLEATPPRSRMNVGFRLRTKSGAVLTVGGTAASLLDDSGNPVGWFIVAQDLPAVDVAERQRLEEFQRVAFEQVNEAIVVVDLSTLKVVDVNEHACRIYGYPREEFLTLDTSALRPPGAEVSDAEIIKSLQRMGVYQSDQELIRRKGGSSFPGSLNIRLVSIGGKPYTVAIVRDLTAQRRAEEFQRVLFEQAGEAIVVVELATRRILEANARACELHGYSREEFLRLRIDDLAAADEATQSRVAEVARTLAEKGRYEGRRVHRRKDGSSFPCVLTLKTVAIGGRTLVIGVHRDLTAQLKAEEYHRVLFEQAGEAIIVIDHPTRKILDANDRAAELHGYTREEFLGLRVEDFAAPPTPDEVTRIGRELEERGHYEGRQLHRRKDGSLFPCSLNLKTLTGLGRRLVIGVHRDLTEELKAEEFHRVLFEQAVDAVAVVDLVSREVVDANDKAAALHGYSREDFLRLRVDEFVVPVTPDQIERHSRELQEKGHREGLVFHRRKDGSTFPCSVNLKTVMIGGRKRVIAVQRDVTEELKAEEFFRVLFERASDALYLVKDDGLCVVEANEAACRMLGYTREEFLKLGVVDLVPPPYRNRIPDFHASVRTGAGYRRDRRMLYRKDGTTIPTDQAVSRVEISGRPYYIASCRDLTEQERVARELEEAKSFLEHVQENASDGLALWDDQGVYVAVNQKCLEMIGARREDVIGKTWMERIGPERTAAYQAYWSKLMAGERHSMRSVLPRPGAPPVTVDINSSMIYRGDRRYVFSIMRDVTEQVKVEEELRRSREDLERHVAERTAQLRESEERFRGAFAQGGIGMAIVNPDGRFIQVNRSLCDMLGYEERDLLATSFPELTHPEDQAGNVERFRKVVEGAGTSVRLEKRYIHRKGHVVWVDLSSTLIRDAGGKPLYFMTTIQEITERKRAEEELRQSEARFRSITEATPLPVTITRPDGTILYVNEATSRLFRLGPEGTAGRNAAEFYADPADRAVVWEKIQKEGSVAGMEVMFRRPDGTLFWTVVNLRLMTFDGGPALLGSFIDIDERKRSEEALRESELRFRAITEGVPVAVIIARASDGRILYANGTAAESLGLDSRHVDGRTIGEFLARPRDREEIQARLTREGFVRDLELQFRKPDGSKFWGITSLRLATYKGERATLGVFSDISARKKAEELLRKAHEELELRVVERTAELARANALLQDEIAERKRAENTLRVILEGTAAVTGGSFFRSLARHLASALNVRYALVVQGIGRPARRARTIAFWNGTDFADPMEYDIQGTPCEDVLAGEACCYSHDVQRLFPDFKALADLGVDSYLGVPIADSTGAVVGQLVVMDRRPISDEELKLSVLKIFAARAGVELERQLAEEALRVSEERWRSLIVNAPDFILTVDRAGLIQSINRVVPGLRMEDVIGKHVFEYTAPESRAKVQEGLDKAFKEGKSHAYETRAVGPNGAEAWYDTRVGPIRIGDQVTGATFIATDITERRAADKALRESEERWRSLVANAPDIITTVDREGRIQSINRLVTTIPREQVVGKIVWGFVPPEFVERVRLAIETVFREGRSVSYETLSGGPNGTKAWYSSRVGPVVLDGRVAAATIISTDITERWKAEQRQKVQHEVTQILSEAGSLEEAVPRVLERVCKGLDWELGLLWTIDAAENVLRFGGVSHASTPAARQFADAVRGFSFRTDVWKDPNFPRRPAAQRSGMHSAFAAPVEGSQGTLGVLEFLSGDVRERDEALLRVITTLGRQLGQFIERQRAEADLRFQKSLLESQSEAAIDGILVVSRDGVMTSYNRRFVQMWEIPDEVLGSKTDEGALQSVLGKLKDPKEFLDRVRYLYDHPDQESRDEIQLKDGRAFDRFSAPVKGPDGELYGRVWYFRDVTGRKQTEENLRRAATETRQMYENLKEAQAQLIRSEKLASIGMLVSGVAHEINNPLNVMYGNLQLLAEVSDVLLPLSVEGAKSKKVRGTVAKVAKFRGMIRDALKAARHAREIVMDFRNFARDTRTAELVDLNQCLEEAVTLIQRELRPGIRVLRKLGRIPQVRCLRGQMSQVFLNLLKNAGESIERKGTVTLRTQQKNGHVMVEVADTGRGMPEEIRRKLFEPFFTTKPVGKGLGLGLSISAMIVHNHNGNITVSSKPGKGSVFRVELPLPP